ARAFLATAGRARTQISRPALQEEAEEEPWDPDSIEVLPTEMKQLRVGQDSFRELLRESQTGLPWYLWASKRRRPAACLQVG
ncbi:unnamed protein product, partial [Effrenium voratum]